jgi:hypothetical protein
VLDEEATGRHVVAIHLDAGVTGVRAPAHACSVVGSPGPDVVDDHVVAVDNKAGGNACRSDAAEAEEDILNHGGVVRVRPALTFISLFMLAAAGAHPKQRGRRNRAGV